MIQPSEDPRITAVLEQVGDWPSESRLALARAILDTVDRPALVDPPRTMPVEELFGILATDDPPPTDEECERIIEEERMRKYGS